MTIINVSTLIGASVNGRNSLQRKGIEVGYLCIPLFLKLTASTDPPWNFTGSNELPVANNNYRISADLSRFDQMRLTGRVVVASTSGGDFLELRYSTSATASLGPNAADGSENISISSTGIKDTGWVDLADAAKAAVWLSLRQNSVAGASREIAQLVAEFRAT